MSKSILIVGATGNTGKPVVQTLSSILQNSSSVPYRIIGLTRSIDSAASKTLAALANVEMIEKDWTTIDAEWLKAHHVVRAYVAPHNLPHQYSDESGLHIALLQAGVKYVVKLATADYLMSALSPVYYARAHLAIEDLLSRPEFKAMQWTSLRPNAFIPTVLQPVAAWIQQFKKTGKQEHLHFMLPADFATAIIDPTDIGIIAARLLALEDPSPHNQKRYVINGPDDVTGNQVIDAVEKYAGVRPTLVTFADESIFDQMADYGYSKSAVVSIREGARMFMNGKGSLTKVRETSAELLALAPPKGTYIDYIKASSA